MSLKEMHAVNRDKSGQIKQYFLTGAGRCCSEFSEETERYGARAWAFQYSRSQDRAVPAWLCLDTQQSRGRTKTQPDWARAVPTGNRPCPVRFCARIRSGGTRSNPDAIRTGARAGFQHNRTGLGRFQPANIQAHHGHEAVTYGQSQIYVPGYHVTYVRMTYLNRIRSFHGPS